MSRIEPKKIKRDISKKLRMTIQELIYILQDINNEEELCNFINEVMPEVIQEENIEILKRYFWGEVGYKWYTKSEIQEIKAEILEKGKSSVLLQNSSILPFLSPEELTSENIIKIFSQETNNRKISQKGVEIIRKNIRKNRFLAEMIDTRVLNEPILDAIGEENIDRIIKYPETQERILKVLQDDKQREVFRQAFEEIRDPLQCLQPEIEDICINMKQIQQENPKFFIEASKLLKDPEINREYKQSELLYLLLHPEEAVKLQTVEDIKQYEENTNRILEETIDSELSTEELKHLIMQRIFRLTITQATELIRKYGDDIQELYEVEKDPTNKKYIQELINLRTLQEIDEANEIRKLYKKLREQEEESVFKNNIWLERKVKHSYCKEIVKDLQSEQRQKEKLVETNEEEGYRIRKISGEYKKMITVIDAFGNDSSIEANNFQQEKWENPKYNFNHARCYSLFSNTNPGVHKSGYKKNTVIAVIKKVTPEAITEASNQDIGSSSINNKTSIIEGKDKYLLGKHYPDTTRSGYSEFVIESEINGENIEIESFLCLDQVNEETIQAAKDMSAIYNRVINIDIVDTNELAIEHSKVIKENFEIFMENGDVQKVIEGIKQFLNTRSAFRESPKSDKWIEENGIFNDTVLNEYLKRAMPKLQANKEDMKKLNNYIQKEKKISGLIQSIMENKILDEIEGNSKLKEIERLGLYDIRMGEIEDSYEVVKNTVKLKRQNNEKVHENKDWMGERT